MPEKKPTTEFGWMILEKLAEMKMSRRDFCEQENIPQSRLSNLITGSRPAKKYKEQVAKVLGIDFRDYK